MNARRSIVVTLVVLGSLVAAASGQVPEPIDLPEPPAIDPAVPPVGLPAMPQPPGAPGLDLPGLPREMPPGMEFSPRQPIGRQLANPLLKLFDTDGDGILSGDEVDAAPARLWELDRNLDAELSTTELDVLLNLRPTPRRRRRGVPGHLPVEPLRPEPEFPALPDPATANERPRVEVYPLRSVSPERALGVVQQVLKGYPTARVTLDRRTGDLLAMAPPSAHVLIRKTLADLLEEDRTGLPGDLPPLDEAMAMPGVPRVIPLYNSRGRDIVRVIKQVYRDKISEPRKRPPVTDPPLPGEPFPPLFDEPIIPVGKMVVGVGADPDTIVVTAEDELFFEVLDLIERLDVDQGVTPEVEIVPIEK